MHSTDQRDCHCMGTTAPLATPEEAALTERCAYVHICQGQMAQYLWMDDRHEVQSHNEASYSQQQEGARLQHAQHGWLQEMKRHTFSSNTWEEEAVRLSKFEAYRGLHRETLVVKRAQSQRPQLRP